MWEYEAAAVILAVAIGLGILTKVIQRKLVDRKKMLEYQENIKKDHKRFNELMKEANKNTRELEELQTQILKQQTEMMNLNMKQSMFTLPGFLVAFWFLGHLYAKESLLSFIPLPKFAGFYILNPSSWMPVGWSTISGYYKMFLFYYLITNIVFGQLEKFYDKWKEGKNKK